PHQLRINATESLGRFPVLGWHLSRTGHMLVDRRRPDTRAVFGWADGLTARGLSLIVFPEGTRSRDGRTAPFKGGSFIPAMHAGLPVVPLSIVGSRHVMRKGRLTTCPGEVTLIVHEPIPVEAVEEPDLRAVRALATRVRGIVAPPVEVEADLAVSADPPPAT
ncbi:MAG: lysophospholipid acyltransferase family protein, partial [Vicinamibacterales bacterium]